MAHFGLKKSVKKFNEKGLLIFPMKENSFVDKNSSKKHFSSKFLYFNSQKEFEENIILTKKVFCGTQ